MTKERLSRLAAEAIESAKFYSTVAEKYKGERKPENLLSISVVTGYRTPATPSAPFGVVLASEKKVFRGRDLDESVVDGYIDEQKKKTCDFKIQEGAERETDANDDEPRVKYFLKSSSKKSEK